METSLIRVCDAGGETHGTGFVLSDSLAVTCAHVVKKCGAAPGGRVRVVFHVNGERREAEVLAEFWRALDGDDIAVLRLLPEGGRLPEGLKPLTLGSARHCNGHTLRTAGFLALPGGYEFTWAEGQIRGVVPHPKKQAMLQIRFDNTKGTHRDKAKRAHPCWVVVGPVGGTFYRPVAFLPFDTLRLSHRNLSPEDRPATTIAVTTLSSSVWSRPAASRPRIRIRS